MKRKRTEITIETERVVVVTGARPRPPVLCHTCGPLGVMLTADEAAAHTQTSARAIFRRVEAGEVHFAETTDGRLLVCLNSLIGAPG